MRDETLTVIKNTTSYLQVPMGKDELVDHAAMLGVMIERRDELEVKSKRLITNIKADLLEADTAIKVACATAKRKTREKEVKVLIVADNQTSKKLFIRLDTNAIFKVEDLASGHLPFVEELDQEIQDAIHRHQAASPAETEGQNFQGGRAEALDPVDTSGASNLPEESITASLLKAFIFSHGDEGVHRTVVLEEFGESCDGHLWAMEHTGEIEIFTNGHLFVDDEPATVDVDAMVAIARDPERTINDGLDTPAGPEEGNKVIVIRMPTVLVPRVLDFVTGNHGCTAGAIELEVGNDGAENRHIATAIADLVASGAVDELLSEDGMASCFWPSVAELDGAHLRKAYERVIGKKPGRKTLPALSGELVKLRLVATTPEA